MLRRMQDEWRRALAARREDIRTRWVGLLRARRPTSPLANPDTLVFLMDWTLDEIMGELRELPTRRTPSRCSPCACGLNPLLDYFATAAEALAAMIDELAAERGLAAAAVEPCRSEAGAAVARVRSREIETFCSVCQRRRAAQLLPEPWMRSR